MFGSSHLDRVRQLFADQFTPEGERIVYRKNLRGPPITVSEAERDQFIRAFNTSLGRMYWGLIGGTMLLIIPLVAIVVLLEVELHDAAIYTALLAPLAVVAPVWARAWNAPARQLVSRPSFGAPLEREGLRKRMLQRLTWGQLLAALLAPAVLLWQLNRDYNLMHGWNRLWLVGAGAYLTLIAVQALRKWNADQDRAP